MTRTSIDPVFYLCFDSNKRLVGMNGSYVYELPRARNSKLKKLCAIINLKLETSPYENLPLSLAGLQLINCQIIPTHKVKHYTSKR